MNKKTEHNPERDNPPRVIDLLPFMVLDETSITIDDAVCHCKEIDGPILVKWENHALVMMPMEYYTDHCVSLNGSGT